MALTEQEKQILIYGSLNKKSPAEIEDAIMRLRTGRPYQVTPEEGSRDGTSERGEFGKGFFKQIGKDISLAGAQNAGPVGAEMLRGAPEFAKNIGSLDETLKLSNPAQEKGATAATVAEFAAPLAPALGRAAVKGAEGLATGLGEAARTLPTPSVPSALSSPAIVQRINRIAPTKQAEFEKRYGSSVGQFLVDRGIVGTTDETVAQLAERMTLSRGEKLRALEGRPELFKSVIAKQALDALEEKAASVSIVGRPSPISERVTALSKKLKGEGLTLSELEEIKYLYEKNVKLDFVKKNIPEGVERGNNIDRGLAELIDTEAKNLGITNVVELNKETAAAKFLLDAIDKASTGRAANNAITLTDWLLLAEGVANPAAIAAFLGKKGVSSERFQAWLARKLAPSPSVGTPKASIKEPRSSLKDFYEEQAFFEELNQSLK